MNQLLLHEIGDSLEKCSENTYTKGDLLFYEEAVYEFLEEYWDDNGLLIRIREYQTGVEKIVPSANVMNLVTTISNILHKYTNTPATEGIICYKRVRFMTDNLLKKFDLQTVPKHPSACEGVTIYDIVHPCQYLYGGGPQGFPSLPLSNAWKAESESESESEDEEKKAVSEDIYKYVVATDETVVMSSRDLFLEEQTERDRINAEWHQKCTDVRTKHKKSITNRFNRKFVGAKHRWLPHHVQQAEFTVTIGKRQPNISDSMNDYLCQVLYYMMTGFQDIYNYVLSHPGIPDKDHCEDGSIGSLEFPKKVKPLPKDLQFYIKVVDVAIKPNAFHEGVWHVEGLPEEHIVATGIYYLDCPLESKILYKRDYTVNESEFLYYNINQHAPRSYDNVLRHSHLPLGEVTITGSSMLFFPNTHIHKVQPIYNNTAKTIHRQCIVFFMVDPDIKLPDWNTVNLSDLVNTTEHPETLKENMQDRMVYKDTLNPREINFCEH